MGFFNSLFRKKQDNTSSDPFEKAVKLENSGKSGEAVAFYKSYIEAHKAAVDAYKNLAELYGRLGKWEDGIKVARLFDSRLSYLHDDWSHKFILKAQEEISKTEARALRNNKSNEPVKEKPKSITVQNIRDEKYNKPVERQTPAAAPKPQYPTQANYRGGSRFPDYADQMRVAIADLPDFDFYTGDDEPNIPNDKVEKVRGIYLAQEMEMLKAGVAEAQKDYKKAASIYEELYKRKCLFPEAYERLIVIYKMSGLESDASYIQFRAKSFFTTLRKQQEKAVLLAAEKYGCVEMVSKQIKEGKRISYYDGLYDLYNSFPFTENW